MFDRACEHYIKDNLNNSFLAEDLEVFRKD
jgi:hypothetical protein